jgi:hypothetical protein
MILRLAGSSRFKAWFDLWKEALTDAGNTVMDIDINNEEISMLNSDGICILNVLSYIGETTLRQFELARKLKTNIYVLETWAKGLGNKSNLVGLQKIAINFNIDETYSSPVDTHIYDKLIFSNLLGPHGLKRNSIIENIKIQTEKAKQNEPVISSAGTIINYIKTLNYDIKYDNKNY